MKTQILAMLSPEYNYKCHVSLWTRNKSFPLRYNKCFKYWDNASLSGEMKSRITGYLLYCNSLSSLVIIFFLEIHLSLGVHYLYPEGTMTGQDVERQKIRVTSEDSQTPWVKKCLSPYFVRYKITMPRILAPWRRLWLNQWKKEE